MTVGGRRNRECKIPDFVILDVGKRNSVNVFTLVESFVYEQIGKL